MACEGTELVECVKSENSLSEGTTFIIYANSSVIRVSRSVSAGDFIHYQVVGKYKAELDSSAYISVAKRTV